LKSLNSSFANHCNANTTSFNPAINYFKIGFDFDALINSSLNAKRLILVKPMIKWSFSATLISFVDEA
jgi:FMN-dependent NADH-azoreductase